MRGLQLPRTPQSRPAESQTDIRRKAIPHLGITARALANAKDFGNINDSWGMLNENMPRKAADLG